MSIDHLDTGHLDTGHLDTGHLDTGHLDTGHVCDHATEVGTPGFHTAGQRGMLTAIRWYQRAFAGRPSPCRFFPSCSAYAIEAIELHGARRGGTLTLRRLLRCRPLGPSGIDLVPLPDAAPSSPVQKGG